MEAKELMDGDLYFDMSIKSARRWDNKRFYEANDADYMSNVCPIPLVIEFFNKNGFEERDNKFVYRVGSKSYFSILRVRGCFFVQLDMMLFQISYVHELQHLLRCCGLNDLADRLEV